MHFKKFAIATVLFLICIVLYSSFSPNWLIFPDLHNFAPPTKVTHPVCHHVAVATFVGWHYEVYMDIADVVSQQLSCGDVRVYAPGAPRPFNYGFEQIVDELSLYHGPLSGVDDFFRDINSSTLFAEEAGLPMIDVVVLGTCELDLQREHDRLLQSWDARPAGKKFQIACMFHDGDDIRWHNNLVEWVRRRAVRILTISEHVGRRLHSNFRALADSKDEYLNSAGYEYVKMDVFVPMLHLPQPQRDPSRALSNVAIQGHLWFHRRDYLGVYADLLTSLKEDPRAWGYLPLSDSPDSVYEVDSTAPLQPFHLHILGDEGDPQIPPALSDVVRLHMDTGYDVFYSVIQSMDLVLPAFASDEYYKVKASSTVSISLQCNVPVLVNGWMRESYSFLDDERVVVTRPQALREIFAVKALRTGQWSPQPALSHISKEVTIDVNKMIEKGWMRSEAQFTSFKNNIWANNSQVMRQILDDALDL